MDAAMRDFLIARDASVVDVIDRTQRAASFFVDPTGEVLGDVLQDDEGIAYAEFDLRRCIEPKQFHDVVGYYNRFDVFDLTINRKRLTPATFVDAVEPAPVVDSNGASLLQEAEFWAPGRFAATAAMPEIRRDEPAAFGIAKGDAG
jgi:nitrilase